MLAQRLPGLQELGLEDMADEQFSELSRLTALSRLSRLAVAAAHDADSPAPATLLPLLRGGALAQLAVRVPHSAEDGLPLVELSGLECLELALPALQVGACTAAYVPSPSSAGLCQGKCASGPACPVRRLPAPQVAPAAAVTCLSRLTELSLDVQLLMEHVSPCAAAAAPAFSA